MDKILKIQTEIGVLSKTETNPFFKSKYFDVNQIIAQLLPLLEKYGLTVIQPLSWVSVGDKVTPALQTSVYDGEKLLIGNAIPLPDLQDPQKMGSAITYYRRYSLQSLFLLQAQDDDANIASEKSVQIGEYKKPMNKKDYADLNKKAVESEYNGGEPF